MHTFKNLEEIKYKIRQNKKDMPVQKYQKIST